MHEYSILQALLAQVDAQVVAHRAVSVVRLQLRVGELSGVDAELLATAFDTLGRQGSCRGACLDISTERARWHCPQCGKTLTPGAVLRCPVCRLPAELCGGRDVVLDRIEMEVRDV